MKIVCSQWLLCWPFNAATFSLDAWVSLSVLSSVTESFSVGLISGDYLGHWRISLEKLLDCFCTTLWVIIDVWLIFIYSSSHHILHRLCTVHIWLNLSREISAVHFIVLLQAVTSSMNTRDPVPLAAIHPNTIISCRSDIMCDRWCDMLHIISRFSPSA